VARHAMSALLELGMLSITEDDQELVPGVRLRHSPGHTPGHRSVILGDVLDVLDTVVIDEATWTAMDPDRRSLFDVDRPEDLER